MTRLFTVAATLVEGDRLQPAANSRHTSAHPAQMIRLMIGRIHFTGSGRGKADILHGSTKESAIESWNYRHGRDFEPARPGVSKHWVQNYGLHRHLRGGGPPLRGS